MEYIQVLTKLRKIIRSVNLESKRIEKEYGISIPQLLCLNYLKDSANFQASHKEIKDFLQLNASTVTGIITRLEKKNLVARLPRKEDRRVGMITVTAKGVELVDNTPDLLHHQLTDRLKKLSEKDIEKLQGSFDIIIQFLDIQDVDASPIVTSDLEINSNTTE